MILLAVALTLYCFITYGGWCVLIPLAGVSAYKNEF